ncbi:MAG TPA: YciI family protein [Rhizobiaceae bacterium]|nr:YciI family protein [Rhizobiaceae bacterium]
MRFVCLVHVDGSAAAALSEEEGRKLTDETIDFDWEMKRRGHLILGQPLEPPQTGTIVRKREGKTSRTDGPFMETKEFLGGFFLIEAEDVEQALAIAELSPMARMGSIEVRAVSDHTHSVTGQKRPGM